MKRVTIAVAFVAVAAAGGIAYQTFVLRAAEPPKAPSAAPAVPGVGASATRKPMPVRIEGIGTRQPIATGAVKSRDDGPIAEGKSRGRRAGHDGAEGFVLPL